MKKTIIIVAFLVMSLGMLGCNVQKPEETAGTEIAESAEVTDKKEIVETEEYVDGLHSDDETLVYQVARTKIVFGHEDGKITRYAVYQDCGTEEAAKAMLNDAFEAEAGEGFGSAGTKPSKLHTVGRYFAFQYEGETFLDSIPLEGVKETYSSVQEIKE